ncbi:uncharacterized protein OCT59_002735 [Rhizophagus irregularis]|uniref:uncharacterized protein n=1 Tax=Rhizophagus irregularis TaxID=588596 RepID=UPI0033184D12|nr:hypothetical protein OCT59_002735 [Rhizophagus irregularis]
MQQKKNKKHFIVNYMTLIFQKIVIDDFSQSSNQNSKKISNIIKAGSKRLSKVFKKLRVNSKSVDTVQNNYYREIQQPQTGDNDDDDEYNNPNLHSKEQEEFEIPDEGF